MVKEGNERLLYQRETRVARTNGWAMTDHEIEKTEKDEENGRR